MRSMLKQTMGREGGLGVSGLSKVEILQNLLNVCNTNRLALLIPRIILLKGCSIRGIISLVHEDTAPK